MTLRRFCTLSLFLITGTIIAQPEITYWDKEETIKKSEKEFKKGVAEGKYTLWHKNGQVAKSGWFMEGVEDSIWKSFYDNGKPKSIENYKMGKKHGPFTYWYQNGKIEMEGTYSAGKQIGKWLFYYPTGKPKQETTFLEKEHLIMNFWDDKGTQTLKDGNGTYKLYFEKGRLKGEGGMKEGRQH